MAEYRIQFIKRLSDDTGHQHDCIEGIVHIRKAKNLERAFQAATHRFERMKKISRWDLYADDVQLEMDLNTSKPFRVAAARPS
jgi:hypothetical protein